MLKSNCEYCGAELISPYSFPLRYCTEKPCKERMLSREMPTHTCKFCKYSWKARRISKVYRCPICQKSNVRNSAEDKATVTVCQHCGVNKPLSKVACSNCKQPNTENTHRYGLTLTQWRKHITFLENYSGDDNKIMTMKKLHLESIQPTLAPEPVEQSLERVEPEPEETLLPVVDALRLLEDLAAEMPP